MSLKIQGKVSSFTFDGSEICLQEAGFSEDWQIEDVTDTCTTGDGEETEAVRAERMVELSGLLKDGSGNRISASAMKITFNSADYNVTDMSLEESGSELEAGDSATTGDGTETQIGFVSRKSSIDFFMKDDAAEPALNSSQTTTILFKTGHACAGSFRFESYKDTVQVKDMVKVSMNGSWQGGVTKTALGLEVGATGTAVIIYKTGTATNKQRSGSAVLTSVSLSANYKGNVKVTYRFKFNGAVTPTQFADS